MRCQVRYMVEYGNSCTLNGNVREMVGRPLDGDSDADVVQIKVTWYRPIQVPGDLEYVIWN
jgi:hypothetical protein